MGRDGHDALTMAEQISRIAELKYRVLFENTMDAVSIVDRSGVLIEVNPRWEEILQRPREQIVGLHIRDFAAPAHAEQNQAAFEATFDTGKVGSAVAVILRADGGVVEMEFSAVTIDLDGRQTVFAIGRDVTEAGEARRKVEVSEQKYRSLVENIPDVVWSATPDGDVTFMSQNVLKLCGYTAEEMIAQHNSKTFSRVHPDDGERVRAAYEALKATGTPLDIEYRRQHKNGHWSWLHSRAVAVRSAGGQIERIDGIFSDVTERRQLEEQVRRAQKMEAIGQLTGGVAHDFNNILSVIIANAHFLLDELQTGDPRRDDAGDIMVAADRAAALTRQLLAFSRQQVTAPVTLDLNQVVAGIEKMLRRLISEDIELVIHADTQPCIARIDPGQLEQVIMNLTVNARDAMPHGGTLRIETSTVVLAADPSIPVDGETAGANFVRLSVRDTGSGMEDATLQHVFEPFFTTKGPGKGTGLGLSTCYGIVRQSDGFIEVESELGVGSTFNVYLPCMEGGEVATRAIAATTSSVGGTETVLLVEDDATLRRAVERTLRARGYQVHAASNRSEALALAAAHSDALALILSDVIMPEVSGFDLVREVQQRVPGIKTMFMSGYTDHALLANRELEVGTRFIQKPFAPDELTLKVRKVLDA